MGAHVAVGPVALAGRIGVTPEHQEVRLLDEPERRLVAVGDRQGVRRVRQPLVGDLVLPIGKPGGIDAAIKQVDVEVAHERRDVAARPPHEVLVGPGEECLDQVVATARAELAGPMADTGRIANSSEDLEVVVGDRDGRVLGTGHDAAHEVRRAASGVEVVGPEPQTTRIGRPSQQHPVHAGDVRRLVDAHLPHAAEPHREQVVERLRSRRVRRVGVERGGGAVAHEDRRSVDRGVAVVVHERCTAVLPTPAGGVVAVVRRAAEAAPVEVSFGALLVELQLPRTAVHLPREARCRLEVDARAGDAQVRVGVLCAAVRAAVPHRRPVPPRRAPARRAPHQRLLLLQRGEQHLRVHPPELRSVVDDGCGRDRGAVGGARQRLHV